MTDERCRGVSVTFGGALSSHMGPGCRLELEGLKAALRKYRQSQHWNIQNTSAVFQQAHVVSASSCSTGPKLDGKGLVHFEVRNSSQDLKDTSSSQGEHCGALNIALEARACTKGKRICIGPMQAKVSATSAPLHEDRHPRLNIALEARACTKGKRICIGPMQAKVSATSAPLHEAASKKYVSTGDGRQKFLEFVDKSSLALALPNITAMAPPAL
ncbi:hypothetical protein AK812_SmicGene18987 [Symbiodinium microadriaticum]|uniref:Uncharacterized protein n=1 Tax=Symbiodinium microadriaticum TaxID=2951 RepID=A0A1Q9DTR7_SYMMI|nr:hypothetical protein AK812_SmicGene18987 [Symbiodinium microadriaticum]